MIELVRENSYPELSVGKVMERAGIERTLFYRHFDGLGDLLLAAGREAIEGLFDAQMDLSAARDGSGTNPDAIRVGMEPVVAFYHRHGPLLRALSEAAASDGRVAEGQTMLRNRFDDLTADALTELPQFAGMPKANVREVARALNLMNASYLLDAFGREPRITEAEAVATITTIWMGAIFGPRPA